MPVRLWKADNGCPPHRRTIIDRKTKCSTALCGSPRSSTGRDRDQQEMTTNEIENQFPDEWVLVGEPQTNDKLEVMKGIVLHHSKDRDEIYRRAVVLPPPKRY